MLGPRGAVAKTVPGSGGDMRTIHDLFEEEIAVPLRCVFYRVTAASRVHALSPWLPVAGITTGLYGFHIGRLFGDVLHTVDLGRAPMCHA